MPDGGDLVISTRQGDGEVVLSVEDSGIGMDEATVAKAFDPFFTTKDVDQGTGLGLSLVHGIVSSLGGTIGVISQPRRGTKFDIHFPVEGPEA
jgi:signal transduction histidine kinase